jgi:hypothetical protein
MKTKSILHGFRTATLCAASIMLAAGAADAKPDKGEKGGKPDHSEKHKGGGKPENKGKPDKGDKDDKGHKDHGKDHKDSHKEGKGNEEWRKISFRDDDRTTVTRYFSGFSGQELGLPPGLAKNYRRGKPLPPGWQKKVYGGYVIEDDHRDYFHPLEYSLFPGLEAVPDTRLYLYGNRIVRVYEPRREVIDIIEVPTIRLD